MHLTRKGLMMREQKITKKNCLFVLAGVAVILTVGCEFDNVPPNKYSVKLPGLIGHFYQTVEKGSDKGLRYDWTITYEKSARWPYVAEVQLDDGSTTQVKFQVYKIGDNYWGFAHQSGITNSQTKSRQGNKYFCWKIRASRTQFVAHILDKSFFDKNPSIMPVNSTPEQVVAFLELHANSRGLFSNEKIILNRIETSK